jgi:hypothetical protein
VAIGLRRQYANDCTTALSTERPKGRKRNDMNENRSAGLRLPVQAAVDRTATGAALADGAGVEASQNLPEVLQGILGDPLDLLSGML